MSSDRYFRLSSGIFFGFLLSTLTVYAVPPPDFLFNAGTIVVQIFSVTALLLTGFFNIFFRFLKMKFQTLGSHKKIWIPIFAVFIVAISLGTSYLYRSYSENKAYNDWISESEKYASPESKNVGTAPRISPEEEVDKLTIGEAPELLESDEPFISLIDAETKDAQINLIEDYYGSIARGDYEHAYELSKKSVSFETFKSWYLNTTQIVLDKATRIDETMSSLSLTLYEGDKYTSYGVLVTLRLSDDGTPVGIQDSKVQILSQGTKGENATSSLDNTFYSENSDSEISISNEDFQSVISGPVSDYFVLDARENLEYENGYFPGSNHIRFADLIAGKWIEVPTDKKVYVFCWSGIRGKEVAEFLRTKNIVASYLEGGASGWVDWGGTWVGNIDFSQTYSEERYKLLFTTEQVKNYVKEGVVLVDSREPSKFATDQIQGSYSIPILYTPTDKIEEVFGQIPQGSTVITVCDGYVNCFDAKITAVELESRGYTFLGRYNKPWEYE
jgi:rhodanese-related sulfurtransferase